MNKSKYNGRNGRKKSFICGHTGFGKFCHLCEQLKNGQLIHVDGKYMPGKKKVIND